MLFQSCAGIDWAWPAVFINGNIGNFRLGNLLTLILATITLGIGGDMDSNRGIADFYHFGIEADDITHEHGLNKSKLVNCHGDYATIGAPKGFDTAGNINL